MDRNIPLTRVRVFLAIALHPGISRVELDKLFAAHGSEDGSPNLVRHIAALRGIEVQGADSMPMPLVAKSKSEQDPRVPIYFLTPTGRGVARDMIRALAGYDAAEAFDVPVQRATEG